MSNVFYDQLINDSGYASWFATLSPIIAASVGFMLAISVFWAVVNYFVHGIPEVEAEANWKPTGAELKALADDEVNLARYEKAALERYNNPLSQLHLDTNSEWDADWDGDDTD